LEAGNWVVGTKEKGKPNEIG